MCNTYTFTFVDVVPVWTGTGCYFCTKDQWHCYIKFQSGACCFKSLVSIH